MQMKHHQSQTMAGEPTTIYLVNFENYLKPKATSKQIQKLPSTPREVPKEKSAFEIFCETSSIHGFSMIYISKQTNTSKCEQITWKVFIVWAVLLSGLIFNKSLIINATTPTATVLETTHKPAYAIAFPAVTLCSLNRVSKAKGLKLAEKFALTSDLSVSEILRLFEVPLYASEDVHPTAEEFKTFDEMLTFNNYSLGRFLDEVIIDCMEDLISCKWKGLTVPCDSIFEVVLAPKGRCCSFNYYARVPYQPHSAPINPRLVSGCGSETGLTVLIDPRVDDYTGGYLKQHGYRVILNDAYDYPEDNSDNEFVAAQTETYIAVKTEATIGTKYLRNMDYLTRECTFNQEHILTFFRQYSYWNCLSECLSFRVSDKCKCIPHHMVQFPGWELCNMTQVDCVDQENEIFQGLVETADILGTKICGCMPQCSSSNYRGITSSGRLNRTFVNGDHRFFQNLTITNQILLHVFVADLTIPLYRMESVQNWQTIVGTAGGITGFTMGFSIVSLCEAIFIVCIRPIYIKCVKLVYQVKAKVLPR